MNLPKSLTGSIHLPDARMTFYLSFDQNGEKPASTAPEGDEAKIIGRILDKAMGASPELRDLLVSFADYIHKNSGIQAES